MGHKCNGSETNAVGKKYFYLVAFVTVVTIQDVPKLATQHRLNPTNALFLSPDYLSGLSSTS
jgi:hypothetical protein